MTQSAPLFLILSFFAQDQQMGARTKAMGGSYTAFEDDPISIFMNPAGIATQASQFAIAYQTYTAYPRDSKVGPNDTVVYSVEPETVLTKPAILPSYAGVVFQLGDAEQSMALGICYARPYHLLYSLDRVSDPNETTFVPDNKVEQSLSRFRAAFAYDLRFREFGKAGFLNHLSAGAGLDVGFTEWSFDTPTSQAEDSSAGLGFGAGLLVGVYDNADSLKINFGAAYQSFIRFPFSVEPELFPAFDMPQQLSVGFTFYLLPKTPLRVTLDAQWIQWSETAESPLFSNHPGFKDALNFSAGAEYQFELAQRLYLAPRAGYRRFGAPWDDKNNLPMTGRYKLVLDTKGETFNIFTFGVGLSWATEAGKLHKFDLGGDVGGDSFNVALGYGQEF